MLHQDQGASIIAEESGRAQFQLPVQMEPSMRCTGHEESIVRVMVPTLAPSCLAQQRRFLVYFPGARRRNRQILELDQ
jgi:hypothetical protein